MGDCKAGMQPTNDKTKSRFSKILDRASGKKESKAIKSDEEVAKTFVDHIVEADVQIETLIGQKERDLKNEGASKEKENKKKLKLLESMQRHVEMIAELGQEYTEL